MPAPVKPNLEKIRRTKRVIGAVAVALLILFTVLALAQLIDFLVWVIADLVVAGVANLLLRRVGRVPL